MDSWLMTICIHLYYFYNEVILSTIVRTNYLMLELFCHKSIERCCDLNNIRIPNHIAMLFTNEVNNLDIESIARLFCWSKLIGTKYVTLYDELGRLKCRRRDLLDCINNELQSLGKEKPDKLMNGLLIISRDDATPRYIDEIRGLVKLKPDCIDYDVVNERLGWPVDPELLISFGSPKKLYGFPPWPLRLTEIFSIPTHRGIPQKIFVDSLIKYSHTIQREGT